MAEYRNISWKNRFDKWLASGWVTRIGIGGILFLLFFALYAPFIANGRPLLLVDAGGGISMPFLHFFFAPDSSEVLVEKFFNFLSVFLPAALLWYLCCKRKVLRYTGIALSFVVMVSGFFISEQRMDKQDYRKLAENAEYVLFAPVPYGPDEIAGMPYAAPDGEHILGCDDIGRDLASRLIYGARVSLAVGIISTVLSTLIGLVVGMCAGYFRGKLDLLLMRLVEVLMCFPTFLLLLILMSMLRDYHIGESIPLVIAVLSLTGWIGMAFLVRGEVLKESSLPYVQSCVVSGVPVWKIMFRHLLPNISAPVLISFSFGIAGAILSESGLSFLGFGVQPPTASWGNLMRQAFDDPQAYWHLTFFPGAVLFIALTAFNFTGEGLRRALDVRER